MTDTTALRACIIRAGHTVKTLAEELGISVCSLSYKLNNKREFRPSEIVAIKNILNLTPNERDAIFFADNVDK